MKTIDTATVGDIVLTMVEMPAKHDPAQLLASSYYVTAKHSNQDWFASIFYLGQNLDHALRKFVRVVDNQCAQQAAAKECVA